MGHKHQLTTTITVALVLYLAPQTAATNHLAPLKDIIIAKLNKNPIPATLTITQLMNIIHTLIAALIISRTSKKQAQTEKKARKEKEDKQGRMTAPTCAKTSRPPTYMADMAD